jgi:hypothetical protein
VKDPISEVLVKQGLPKEGWPQLPLARHIHSMLLKYVAGLTNLTLNFSLHFLLGKPSSNETTVHYG